MTRMNRLFGYIVPAGMIAFGGLFVAVGEWQGLIFVAAGVLTAAHAQGDPLFRD